MEAGSNSVGALRYTYIETNFNLEKKSSVAPKPVISNEKIVNKNLSA